MTNELREEVIKEGLFTVKKAKKGDIIVWDERNNLYFNVTDIIKRKNLAIQKARDKALEDVLRFGKVEYNYVFQEDGTDIKEVGKVTLTGYDWKKLKKEALKG